MSAPKRAKFNDDEVYTLDNETKNATFFVDEKTSLVNSFQVPVLRKYCEAFQITWEGSRDQMVKTLDSHFLQIVSWLAASRKHTIWIQDGEAYKEGDNTVEEARRQREEKEKELANAGAPPAQPTTELTWKLWADVLSGLKTSKGDPVSTAVVGSVYIDTTNPSANPEEYLSTAPFEVVASFLAKAVLSPEGSAAWQRFVWSMALEMSPAPTNDVTNYRARFRIPQHVPAFMFEFGMVECMAHELFELPHKLRPFLVNWRCFSLAWRNFAVPILTRVMCRVAALVERKTLKAGRHNVKGVTADKEKQDLSDRYTTEWPTPSTSHFCAFPRVSIHIQTRTQMHKRRSQCYIPRPWWAMLRPGRICRCFRGQRLVNT